MAGHAVAIVLIQPPFFDKMTCSLVISERSRIVKAGLHLPGCVAGRQKTALAKLITDRKRETGYGEKYRQFEFTVLLKLITGLP